MIGTLALAVAGLQVDGARPIDVALSSRSDVVALASRDGSVHILDAATGASHEGRRAPAKIPGAWVVAVEPEGNVVAILDRSGGVHLWSWREDEAPEVAHRLAIEPRTGEWAFGATLEFAPRGGRLLVGVAGEGASLLHRDGTPVRDDGRILRTGERLGGHFFEAPLAWSGDGTRFAALLNSGPAVFDAERGRRLGASFDVGETELRAIALDAKGQRLFVSGEAVTLIQFEVETGRRVWTSHLKPPDFGMHLFGVSSIDVSSLALSPDERLLACATSSASHAALLDARDGRHLWLGGMHGGRMGEPRLLAWSRDGKRLFHTYASGGMALVEVQINRLGGRFLGAREIVHERGAAPVFDERGLGVRITGGAVLAFDGDAGKVLWKRTL
ncbi:MAG: PQQ-binding-like beta-propeller repeat protein [Planctomycetota bacterium]